MGKLAVRYSTRVVSGCHGMWFLVTGQSQNSLRPGHYNIWCLDIVHVCITHVVEQSAHQSLGSRGLMIHCSTVWIALSKA